MHHTQSTDTIHSDKVFSARPLAGSSSVASVLEADLSLSDSFDCSTITSNSLGDLRFQSFDFTSHYLSNQQYSVTAVTTSTGSVAERYAYTAYGQPTFLDDSGTPLTTQTSTLNARYLYTGREWDATLGLYHFRARWMSGVAGRFLQRDPIGFEGSEWSLYETFNSTPFGHMDPLGETSLIPGQDPDDPFALPIGPPPPLWSFWRNRHGLTKVIQDNLRIPALGDCSGVFIDLTAFGMRFGKMTPHVQGGCNSINKAAFNKNLPPVPFYQFSVYRTCICGECKWTHRFFIKGQITFPLSRRYINPCLGIDCSVQFNYLIYISMLVNLGLCK